jgi:hypothetical protein
MSDRQGRSKRDVKIIAVGTNLMIPVVELLGEKEVSDSRAQPIGAKITPAVKWEELCQQLNKWLTGGVSWEDDLNLSRHQE